MTKQRNFQRTTIVLALAAVFPFAAAHAEDEVAALTSPNVAEASVNLSYTDKINPLYRQYTGVNNQGPNGNLGINIVNRNDNGEWFKVQGENLGLITQEIGASYEKQGDWAVGLNYNQIPRYAPYEISTQVTGIGNNTLSQPVLLNTAFTNGALTNPSLYAVTLKTERDITTLSASKFLLEGLKFNFTFKNEDKYGTRLDGVRGVAGNAGSVGGSANRYSGFLFTPEPINQNHKQFEASIDYVTSKFQISAGYYGSFLSTTNNALNLANPTSTNTAAVAANLTAIALAPDNQMQQFYVNGGYNFSSDTRGTLKLAYSEGRQNDPFMSGQVTSAGIGPDLAAKVTTSEVYGSLTSRITKDLKVLGSWRYEDKSDKTPVRTFYTNYPNNPESHKANWGKLEADYNLGNGYGLTGGVDYTQKKSEEWERREVSELTSRIALRKSMSDTVNGAISVAHSERDGADWQGNPTLYPVYLANRQRDKIRGMVDWMASDNLNLQFAYEAYFDTYRKSNYGLESGDGQVLSADASYALNDVWKLNGWVSKQTGVSKQNMQGAVCSTNNNSNCTANTFRTGALVQWDATLKLDSDQFGFGLTGKIKAIDVGAQYMYSRDTNRQDISPMPTTTCLNAGCVTSAPVAAGMGILPDTKYTLNSFKLFGVYPIAKSTKLRLDYIYDQRKMDDYTWQNWVYADGTKVYVKPEQSTQILGLTLIQSF